MTLAPILEAIEEWLAAHAPVTWRSLAPPATDDDLARAADALGVELLPEVMSTLRWHNGAAEGEDFSFQLAPGFYLLSAEGMVDAAQVRAGALRLDPFLWKPLWIPLGEDGFGGHLVVDHGEGPTCGHAIVSHPEDGVSYLDSWPGLTELYGQLLDAMRNGTVLHYSQRTVVDGALIWDDTVG